MRQELTFETALRLLTPTPEQLVIGSDLFDAAAPSNCQRKHFLDYAVKENILTVKQIDFEYKPAYMVWYHLTPQGTIHFNAAVALAKAGLDVAILFHACDLLAKQHGCKIVTFNTTIAAMARLGNKFGYKPESIRLVKHL